MRILCFNFLSQNKCNIFLYKEVWGTSAPDDFILDCEPNIRTKNREGLKWREGDVI